MQAKLAALSDRVTTQPSTNSFPTNDVTPDGQEAREWERATTGRPLLPNLPAVGKGRFFEDSRRLATDISLINRFAATANWTDEEMEVAHDNIACLTTCEDPNISMKAYDLMRKTAVEAAKVQIQNARLHYDLSKPAGNGADGQMGQYHNHNHLHVQNAEQSSADADLDPAAIRVDEIARSLGITIDVEEVGGEEEG